MAAAAWASIVTAESDTVTPYKELLEKLRSKGTRYLDPVYHFEPDPVCAEAAKVIEALCAEIEKVERSCREKGLWGRL